YAPLLEPAGFELKKAYPGKAWIGDPRMEEREGLIITGNTLRGTPLYTAGLDVDDKITSIDNQDIRSYADLNAVLSRLHPGTAVSIRYFHRNEEQDAQITPVENPNLMIGTFESAGLTVTPAVTQFRQQWLGTK
ncbi:MAG TPA: PDZ domain-containing protein, partial [Puia sp.]|nr:PDZ domain-containing protein [Puia sp.]